MRLSFCFVAGGLGLALLSCARLPEQSPARQPGALPPGATPPGAPETPWTKKTRAERMEFMGLFFFPRMKTLFQKQDPAGYAQFRCQTCHGDDMEAVNFRMPNGLYTLPTADPVKAAHDYDEKTTAFMTGEVEPAAQELFGIPHGTGTDQAPGRSCSLCHGAE
jgi:cytochrome c553